MRMNISVPDDLKKRMDKAKDVNWSALACKAFTEKLDEITSRKTVNMKDVIERLRGSNQKAEGKSFKNGFDAGQEWAKADAEADELRRLDRARDQTHDWYFGVGSSAYGDDELFFFIIHPEVDKDRDAAKEFWESALGDSADEREQPGFVNGFAHGAMEIWGQVEREVGRK